MTVNGKEMTVETIQHGNVEIVVYRPVLDDNERKRRERNLIKALEHFGKEMQRKGLL